MMIQGLLDTNVVGEETGQQTESLEDMLCLLNSIADDLDFLLNDLYKNSPHPGTDSQSNGSTNNRSSLLEQYVAAGADDDDALEDENHVPAHLRTSSVLSAHLDVFGLDDEDKGLHMPEQNGLDAMEQQCNTGDEPRFIPIVERLIKTHSVWYLPMIDRGGALKLLKNKPDGVFVVRQSSRKDTMALSFRLAWKPGGFDHYLIEFTGKGLRIEGSMHVFPAMPMLIAHYCEQLDELPCQLALPEAILKANTSQELNSIALLGKDFWTSPLIEWTGTPHSTASSHVDIKPFSVCSTSHTVSSPVTISDMSKKRISKDILLTPSSDYDTSDLPTSVFQVPQSQCFMGNFQAEESSGTSSSKHSTSSRPSTKSDASSLSKGSQLDKSELYTFHTDEFEENAVQEDMEEPERVSFASTSTFTLPPCDCSIDDDMPQDDSELDSGTDSDISSDETDFDERHSEVESEKENETFHKESSPYFKGDFNDRQSDYEDVWTPTQGGADDNCDLEIKDTATRLNNNTDLAKAQEEFRNNINALTRALSLSTGSLNKFSDSAKSPRFITSPSLGFVNPGFGSLKKPSRSVESLNLKQDSVSISSLLEYKKNAGVVNRGFENDIPCKSSNDSTEKITSVDCTFELPDVSMVTQRPDISKLDVIPTLDRAKPFGEGKFEETNGNKEPEVHVSELTIQVNQVEEPKREKIKPPPLDLTNAKPSSQNSDPRPRKYSSPAYAEPIDAITSGVNGVTLSEVESNTIQDQVDKLLQDLINNDSNVLETKNVRHSLSVPQSDTAPPIPPRIGWVRRRKSAPTIPLNANVKKMVPKEEKSKDSVGSSQSRPPVPGRVSPRPAHSEQAIPQKSDNAITAAGLSNLILAGHASQPIGFQNCGRGRIRTSSPAKLCRVPIEKARPFPGSPCEEIGMPKAMSFSGGLHNISPENTAKIVASHRKVKKLSSIEDVPDSVEQGQASPEVDKKKSPRKRRILGRPLSLKVEKSPQCNKKETKRSLSLRKGKSSPSVDKHDSHTPPLEASKNKSPRNSKKSLLSKGDKSVESLEGSKTSLKRPCSFFGCQSSNQDCPGSEVSSFKSYSTPDLNHDSAKPIRIYDDPKDFKNLDNPPLRSTQSPPRAENQKTLSVISDRTSFSEVSTVEDLIRACSPELTVKPTGQLTLENLQRLSAYDNLHCTDELQSPTSTVFCKPWDSTVWENLLAENSGNVAVPSEVTKAVQEWIQRAGSSSELDCPTSVPYTGKSSASVAESWTYHPGDSAENENTLTRPRSQNTFERRAESYHNANSVSQQRPGSFRMDGTSHGTQDPPNGPSRTPHFNGIDIAGPRIPVHEDKGVVSDSWVNLSLDERRPSFAMEAVEDTTLTAGSPRRPTIVDDDKSDVSESFRNRIMPYLGAPRVVSMRNRGKDPGIKIRDSITRLALDQNTTFGCTIVNFIKCTMESSEVNPNIVMRNVRQFMSGIKNYLTKHGEGQLQDIIERERNKLHEDEFLNIDAILEGSLHKCVIKPLKQHLYSLFVQHHTKNGNLELLSSNIKYARNKSPVEIGIRPGLLPPSGANIDIIQHYLDKMQKAYSPLKKLENLLGATSAIYNGVEEKGADGRLKTCASMGADDFLPVFIYVIVRCGLISAEIEAEYMWGLLHPSLLAGEGGYYLTTLSSAVHVLKNLREGEEMGSLNTRKFSRCSSINDSNMQGVMKILIPDEKNDSIIAQPLPVRPNMSAKDVCSLIAHKFKVTNPQDYGLYILVDKAEIRMQDSECPQGVKADYAAVGLECRFAYKRNDATFAWPVMPHSQSL